MNVESLACEGSPTQKKTELERLENIRKAIRESGERWRSRYPILKQKNLIGVIIAGGSNRDECLPRLCHGHVLMFLMLQVMLAIVYYGVNAFMPVPLNL